MKTAYQQQIDEITQRLQEGVQALFTSDKYQEYLDGISKFHHYSAANILLILSQMPDATYVAGYQRWQKDHNRQVQRGQKGIRIIAPIIEKEDPNDASSRNKLVGYRRSTVYDISQTEGEPLPSICNELQAPIKNYDLLVRAVIQASPVPVLFQNFSGTAKGYYSPKEQKIVIKTGLSQLQSMKTMLHELAHCLLRHGEPFDETDRSTREVEAQSVSYCVCQILGQDTSSYAFGYITSWAAEHPVRAILRSMDRIKKTTGDLLEAIASELIVIQGGEDDDK